MYPDLDGKERHALVRKRWQALPDEKKITYVMKSRVDKERAIYQNKLTQIRENLISEFPQFEYFHDSQKSKDFCVSKNTHNGQNVVRETGLAEEQIVHAAIQRIRLELIEADRKVIREDDDENSEDFGYGTKAEVTDDSKEIKTCPIPSLSSIQKMSPDQCSTPIDKSFINLQQISLMQSNEVSSSSACLEETKLEKAQITVAKNSDQIFQIEEEKKGEVRDDDQPLIETHIENGKRMTQLKIKQFMK